MEIQPCEISLPDPGALCLDKQVASQTEQQLKLNRWCCPSDFKVLMILLPHVDTTEIRISWTSDDDCDHNNDYTAFHCPFYGVNKYVQPSRKAGTDFACKSTAGGRCCWNSNRAAMILKIFDEAKLEARRPFSTALKRVSKATHPCRWKPVFYRSSGDKPYGNRRQRQ